MQISNLTKRSNTLVFTARLDIRSFVTLARYMKENGMHLQERAAVVNEGLEYLASLIRQNDNSMRCDTHYEAVQWMAANGFGNAVTENNRNRSMLIKALALEGIEAEQENGEMTPGVLVDVIEQELRKRANIPLAERVVESEARMKEKVAALGVRPTVNFSGEEGN